MSNPAAGWYPDPTGQPNTIRWWNGTQWTNKTEKEDPAPDSADAPTAGGDTSGSAAAANGGGAASNGASGGEASSADGATSAAAAVSAAEKAKSTWIQPAAVASASGHWTQQPLPPDEPQTAPTAEENPETEQTSWTLKLASDSTSTANSAAAGTTAANSPAADSGQQNTANSWPQAADAESPTQTWAPTNWTQQPDRTPTQPTGETWPQQPSNGPTQADGGAWSQGSQTGADNWSQDGQASPDDSWQSSSSQQTSPDQWQSSGQQAAPEHWQSAGGQQAAPNQWQTSGGNQTTTDPWQAGGEHQGAAGQWPDGGAGQWPGPGAQQVGPGRAKPGKDKGRKEGKGGGRVPVIIAAAVALVLIVVAAVFYITSQGDKKTAGPGTSTSPSNKPSNGSSTGTTPTTPPGTPGNVPPGQSKNPKLHEAPRISSDAISFPRQGQPWSDRKRLVAQLLNSSGQYVRLQEKFDGKNDWYADMFVGRLGTGTLFNGDPQATASDLSLQVRGAMYGDIPVTFKQLGNGPVKRSGKAGWFYQQSVTVNSPKVISRVLTLTVAVFDLGDGTAVAYISDIPVNRPDLRTAESQVYKGINVG